MDVRLWTLVLCCCAIATVVDSDITRHFPQSFYRAPTSSITPRRGYAADLSARRPLTTVLAVLRETTPSRAILAKYDARSSPPPSSSGPNDDRQTTYTFHDSANITTTKCSGILELALMKRADHQRSQRLPRCAATTTRHARLRRAVPANRRARTRATVEHGACRRTRANFWRGGKRCHTDDDARIFAGGRNSTQKKCFSRHLPHRYMTIVIHA